MGVFTRRFLITIGAALTLALGMSLISSPAPAAAAGKVIAKKTIKASSGGVLRAPNGVQLVVPPEVMSRNGTARITALGKGRYDIHISVPWSGVVGVRVPIRGSGDRIIHQVGGIWVPEGGLGQRTVWVSQLSSFWSWKTAANAGQKIKQALCVKSVLPRKILECLVQKGLTHISKDLADWIARKISSSCAAAVAASAFSGPGMAITIFFDEVCIGRAGDPEVVPEDPVDPGPVDRTPVYEPEFGVVNTATPPPDGVYFRNSASWNDTARITGLGIFTGERLRVRCYVFGEAVGPYANRVWYQALNVSRPTAAGRSNEGFMPARYVDDGQVANVVAPGVRAC